MSHKCNGYIKLLRFSYGVRFVFLMLCRLNILSRSSMKLNYIFVSKLMCDCHRFSFLVSTSFENLALLPALVFQYLSDDVSGD